MLQQLQLEEALLAGNTEPIFKAIQKLKAKVAQLNASVPLPNQSKTSWEEHKVVTQAFEAARAVLTRSLLEYDIKKNSSI